MHADIRVDAPGSARYEFFFPLIGYGLVLLGVFFVLVIAGTLIPPFERWLEAGRRRRALLYVPMLLGVAPMLLAHNTPRPSAAQMVAALEENYGVTYLEPTPDTAMPRSSRQHSWFFDSETYLVRVNSTGRVVTDCVTDASSPDYKPYIAFTVVCGGKDITEQPGVKKLRE